jgi:hypothetical protein
LYWAEPWRLLVLEFGREEEKGEWKGNKPPKDAARIPEMRGIRNHIFGAYIWN